MLETRDQRFEEDFTFHPRDHLAQTLVDAEAQADMAAGGAFNIELLGSVPFARIAIGRSQNRTTLAPSGIVTPLTSASRAVVRKKVWAVESQRRLSSSARLASSGRARSLSH